MFVSLDMLGVAMHKDDGSARRGGRGVSARVEVVSVVSLEPGFVVLDFRRRRLRLLKRHDVRGQGDSNDVTVMMGSNQLR